VFGACAVALTRLAECISTFKAMHDMNDQRYQPNIMPESHSNIGTLVDLAQVLNNLNQGEKQEAMVGGIIRLSPQAPNLAGRAIRTSCRATPLPTPLMGVHIHSIEIEMCEQYPRRYPEMTPRTIKSS